MSSTNIQPVLALLESALEQTSRRKELISGFQKLVWDAPDGYFLPKEEEILGDLAYDLDFYEPDITLRKDSESYCGDERLEEVIKAAFKQLDWEV